MRQRASGVTGYSSSKAHMNLLGLILFEIQHWGSSLKGTRDLQKRTKLSGIKVRAGGTAFCQTEVLFLFYLLPQQSWQMAALLGSPSTYFFIAIASSPIFSLCRLMTFPLLCCKFWGFRREYNIIAT